MTARTAGRRPQRRPASRNANRVPAGPAAPGRATSALVWAALVLAVIGTGISAYLVFERLQGSSPVCIGTHGCATVQKSKYSAIFGVPVATMGMALYLVLAAGAVAWLRDLRGQRPQLAALAFYGTLFGLLFSGYLTYLEAFVIDAWCIWCISSALVMTVLFATWLAVLALTLRRR